MGANSNIEWTTHTFNPWIGCTKVSPGCLYCYAEQLDITRFSKVLGEASKACPVSHWGKGAPRYRTTQDYWNGPRRWNTHEESAFKRYGPRLAHIRRPRVFCASLADWLDDEVPIQWLIDLLDLIRTTPQLDWLLLTKRPENFLRRVGDWGSVAAPMELQAWVYDWFHGKPPANVWIGTTVEDQHRANERIPALLGIPARVRFLSCEPLLSAVDLASAVWNHTPEALIQPYMKSSGRNTVEVPLLPGIDWVICGGESGKHARPMQPDWARSLRDQCANAGVAFFFKQWGEWGPYDRGAIDSSLLINPRSMDHPLTRWGKITAGRRLDDKEHNALPA